ncbi:MAG: BlaI/MecI/CopY family transcriptional regulator [Gemmatimonadetes bacterium]|nr:BlaI/MecI/CopY family transcriptional regulator [Gemmatimonadota bacterium]
METSFTDRELDVMSALWQLGSGTVAEVRDALGHEAGYTTVLKILQILEEKGSVRHEVEGRAYRYHPVVAAEQAGGPALRRVLDKIFLGSAESLLANLVDERELTPAEIWRMQKLLDDAAKRGER